ncbi:lipopolysaccharide heptosyltransferase II [Helicobacter sp. MIT 21-1697]|uniref:lipopolysaccharide heptosyltransferase II n=1 Tax=Helicobacter sp. MIT 21-1697 TaxID=2993733 RepID=UPI00224A9490|nr:lipopolysaccharide heptosyltransferase II [Helicobacter sp. MIT 21-1697]MCX2716601.1 lipopolysaccharide heptosyltransferase II [Helicobacter sp. MIT 21-1697]
MLSLSPTNIATQEIKKILLRLPNWLGDSVMISPAFEWLKCSFDKADFTLVGSKASCGIYERDTRVKHIFIDESKKAPSRILATKKLAKQIGTHDIAITFSNTFFSALLLYLSKSAVRIGYAKNARGFLLTHAFPLEKYDSQGQKYHQVLLYLLLIAPLAQVQKQAIAYYTKVFTAHTESSHLTHNEHFAPKDILSILSTQPLTLISQVKKSPQSHTYAIGINPGAAFGSAKRWEQAYFITIIEHFLTQGYEVYLFGSSAESDANISIANALTSHSQMQHFHNLTDKTNLSELIDYIAIMDIFITNDSGPMHIAAALKVPMIAIFGPTDINETAPYIPSVPCVSKDCVSFCKNQHIQSLYTLICKSLPCAPCKKRECPLKHHHCMKFITPTEVIAHTQNLLTLHYKRLNNDT